MTTLFITGIDTNVGKSIACGALAKTLIESGHHVFTQKLVETGCKNSQSADLETHINIVGTAFNTGKPEHHCPYTFSYPASPHLAAQLEGKEIDCDDLLEAMKALQKQSEHLLIEGAGGLYVPLNKDTQIIDFIDNNDLAIVLVTSAKLGSINHSLLSLAACQQRNIEVRAVIYNHFGQGEETILNDTRHMLKTYIRRMQKKPVWLELEKNRQSIVCTEDKINKLLYF